MHWLVKCILVIVIGALAGAAAIAGLEAKSDGAAASFAPANSGAIALVKQAVPAGVPIQAVRCPSSVDEAKRTRFGCQVLSKGEHFPTTLEVVGPPSKASTGGFLKVIAIGLAKAQVESCESFLGAYNESGCKVFLWG